MFKDMSADAYLKSAGIASDWPIGRGCYISDDKKLIVWVGEEDHLRIMCMFEGTLLNDVFARLHKALEVVSAIPGLEFAFSKTYGNVTSCPSNLGTGMRASVHIKLPNLTSDGTDAKAKAICAPLGLSVRGLGGEHTPIGKDGTVDISPSARFCIKESTIITNLYKGLQELVRAEGPAAVAAAASPAAAPQQKAGKNGYAPLPTDEADAVDGPPPPPAEAEPAGPKPKRCPPSAFMCIIYFVVAYSIFAAIFLNLTCGWSWYDGFYWVVVTVSRNRRTLPLLLLPLPPMRCPPSPLLLLCRDSRLLSLS